MQVRALKAPLDQIVPGMLAHAVPVAGLAAGDDQPIGRPRHRNIEQAAIFVLGLLQHGGPRRYHGRRIVGLASRPDHGLAAVSLRQLNETKPLGVRW